MAFPEVARGSNPFPFDVPIAELRRRRSAKWTTYAADVLPLPIAEMDVRLAPPIAAALQAAVDASDTGYSGDPEALDAAFSGFAQRRWNWQVDVGDIRLCADVAIGITEVLRRVAEPGESVIIMPPVYPRFYAWLRETGLRAAEVPLQNIDVGGRLDLAGIAAALAAGSRIVLLCNPHNPTGRVHTASELRSLAELAARHGAIVLADEVHGPLVYRDRVFSPYLGLSDEARATGIAFTSASKAWNIPGLKCALLVAGKAHHDKLLKQLPHERAWGVGHFGYLASIAAFAQGERWLDDLIDALASNARLLRDLLERSIPAIEMAAPRAGYLAWLDCTSLDLGAEPAKLFLERARVALTPGLSFGPPGRGHARLNFACSPDILREAIARIAQALQ